MITDELKSGEESVSVLPGNPAGLAGTHRWRSTLLVGSGYLLCSLFIWSNIWFSHPTSTTNCTCNDTSAYIWFLQWSAYALSHGQNLFYSTALFHPTGINLLSNTGVVVIGVALAPITWLFGPIATLNVAMTLAPVVSALAVFVVLRRWVTWLPAAFMGGLFYGFCPFILQSLLIGQLHQSVLMFPPLIVLCLDEILFRQRARPALVGVLLGLFVAFQFFVGSEILVMFAMIIFFCVALIGIYWLRQPDKDWAQVRYATIGLTVGGIAAICFLAYPVWFALAGPAHLSGRIWPLPTWFYGNVLSEFIKPAHAPFSPFTGANIAFQYFGAGMLVVCAVGIVVWRRDCRLRVFAGAAVLSLLLSLGEKPFVWLPWQLFGHLPLLENVFPYRFVIVAYLAAGIMLGLIVDHTYVAVRAHRHRIRPDSPPRGSDGAGTQSSRWPALLVGIIVSAVAVVPMAVYLAPTVPFPSQSVVFPAWFRTVAPHLAGRQTLLVLPMPFFLEVPLTWQALNQMHYSLASGVGPEGSPSRAGKALGGQILLDDMSAPSVNVPVVDPGGIRAVRQAMDDWGVTTVVIPADEDAHRYEWRVISVPVAVELMTLVTGERPVHQEHAWVWYGVKHDGPPAIRSTAVFDRCATTAEVGHRVSIEGMITCGLTAPPAAP